MTRNKLVSLFISLVIAIGLWVYVVNNVTPEDTQWIYRIPVTFSNEDGLFSDRNLVLSSGRDTTVDLELYGKRSDLQKLNNTNLTISADLSQVTGSGEWRLPYSIEYPANVSGNDISVERRSSYYINITVDMLSTKSVEVRAVFQGDVTEGYTQEAIELEYETIDVSGPRDLVALVDHAQVVLERTNVSRTVSDNLSFTLLDADGNEVSREELRCTVNGTDVDKIGILMPVNMVKEVPLRVELIEGGGASENHAVVSIEPAYITIQGDPEVLAGLNSVYLGTVDLASIQSSVTEDFTIVIADGLKNMTGTTAKVTVELRNLKTKTFRVTNIEYTNAPEGYTTRLGTLSLEVQVRGAEETVDALKASGIRAVADLSGISATGQFSVPADIYIDGASDVGAVGEYSILVTISVPAEATTTVEVAEVSPSPTTESSGVDQESITTSPSTTAVVEEDVGT